MKRSSVCVFVILVLVACCCLYACSNSPLDTSVPTNKTGATTADNNEISKETDSATANNVGATNDLSTDITYTYAYIFGEGEVWDQGNIVSWTTVSDDLVQVTLKYSRYGGERTYLVSWDRVIFSTN